MALWKVASLIRLGCTQSAVWRLQEPALSRCRSWFPSLTTKTRAKPSSELQAAVIPALGAVVNAVFNATGIRILELPITPDKIRGTDERSGYQHRRRLNSNTNSVSELRAITEETMKAFEWVNPSTTAEAVRMLNTAAPASDIDEAPRPLAGGQDLITTMKDYTTRPSRLVNLKSIRGLDRITADSKGGVNIGALVTLNQLEAHPVIRKNFPGLAEAAHSIATPQIRNLGTIGGNLCQRPRCWYFAWKRCLPEEGRFTVLRSDGENKYNAISVVVHHSSSRDARESAHRHPRDPAHRSCVPTPVLPAEVEEG